MKMLMYRKLTKVMKRLILKIFKKKIDGLMMIHLLKLINKNNILILDKIEMNYLLYIKYLFLMNIFYEN